MYRNLIEKNKELLSIALESDERKILEMKLLLIAEGFKKKLTGRIREAIEDRMDVNEVVHGGKLIIRIKGKDYGFNYEKTKIQYEEILKDLLEYREHKKNCIYPVDQIIKKAIKMNIIHNKKDIDYFFCLGGMMSVYSVQDTLRNYWGSDSIIFYPEFDQAVVKGAAVYSALKSANIDWEIKEPSPDALYIKLENGFKKVLGRTENQKELFLTSVKDSDFDYINISVFGGEESANTDNCKDIYHTLVHLKTEPFTIDKNSKKPQQGDELYCKIVSNNEKEVTIEVYFKKYENLRHSFKLFKR